MVMEYMPMLLEIEDKCVFLTFSFSGEIYKLSLLMRYFSWHLRLGRSRLPPGSVCP